MGFYRTRSLKFRKYFAGNPPFEPFHQVQKRFFEKKNRNNEIMLEFGKILKFHGEIRGHPNSMYTYRPRASDEIITSSHPKH